MSVKDSVRHAWLEYTRHDAITFTICAGPLPSSLWISSLAKYESGIWISPFTFIVMFLSARISDADIGKGYVVRQLHFLPLFPGIASQPPPPPPLQDPLQHKAWARPSERPPHHQTAARVRDHTSAPAGSGDGSQA